jgi:hypothetical protein
MTRKELMEFIDKNLRQQGSASSTAAAVLAAELANHVPCVVHIGDKQEGEDGKSIYKVTDEPSEINAIVDALKGNEEASVIVHDKGVTLHFNHIEIADDMVQCYLTTFDGNYNLTLSGEEGFSELCFVENGAAVFSNDFNNDFKSE